MEVKFLYEIGATLVHRACAMPPLLRQSVRLFVMARYVDNCPGGVQLHYLCRMVNAVGCPTNGAEKFLEHELMPLSEHLAALDAQPKPSPGEMFDAVTAALHRDEGRREE